MSERERSERESNGSTCPQCYYVILIRWKVACVREMTKEERIDLMPASDDRPKLLSF